MSRRRLVVTLLMALAAAVPAQAQTTAAGARAVALDTVVGVQDFFDDSGAWKTQLIVDPF